LLAYKLPTPSFNNDEADDLRKLEAELAGLGPHAFGTSNAARVSKGSLVTADLEAEFSASKLPNPALSNGEADKLRKLEAELVGLGQHTFGTSNAARVSKGSLVDTGHCDSRLLSVANPQRHPNEHVTVTVVLYYVCSGGIPSEGDVRAAVDDLEGMYRSVESGRLADDTFNFMKSELSVQKTSQIHTKLATQPSPKPPPPKNWNVFPITLSPDIDVKQSQKSGRLEKLVLGSDSKGGYVDEDFVML
jgi:hypothetical protein